VIVEAADFKGAFQRYQKDEMGQRAAALTYYALMSLFPALLIGVAVLGYFGQAALVSDAADYLKDAGAPPETVDAITKALQSAQSQRGTALGALIIGLVTALWGAAGAFGSVGSALNQVFRVDEGRGFVKHKLQNLFWTLLLILLAAITLMLLFLGGGLAADVLGLIGLGDSAVSVWNVVCWQAALLVAMLVYAVVYYAAPNVEIRNWRYITPGAVTGVVLWIIASAGFFFYVSSFASYSATYGAFATVVILLIWLYLTSAVLLLGAELNAVVDLRRSHDLPRNYDGPVLPPKEPAEA
jgi:membrane protein